MIQTNIYFGTPLKLILISLNSTALALTNFSKRAAKPATKSKEKLFIRIFKPIYQKTLRLFSFTTPPFILLLDPNNYDHRKSKKSYWYKFTLSPLRSTRRYRHYLLPQYRLGRSEKTRTNTVGSSNTNSNPNKYLYHLSDYNYTYKIITSPIVLTL